MSDPVSNNEIEDVLSSIRRLVSEETGSHPRPDPVRQPPKSNRLVLTPSLRVLTEPEDAAPSEDEVDAIDEVEQTSAFDDDPEPIVDPDHIVDQEIDDDAPWTNPYATLYTAAKIEPDSPDIADTSEAISEPLGNIDRVSDASPVLPEDVPAPAFDEQVNQRDMADADVFVMTNRDHGVDVDPVLEVEMDLAEDDTLAQDLPDEPNAPPLSGLHIVSETDHDQGAAAKDAGLDDLVPLSAKIAALETAIGETQDQWEPDGAAGDDYAGTTVQTLRWKDHDVEQPEVDVVKPEITMPTLDSPNAADLRVDAENKVHAEDKGDAEGKDAGEQDFFIGDDGIMDEESLRELVAEIVHAELQGALGERITRNVRKLVRREIHRALTSQELD